MIKQRQRSWNFRDESTIYDMMRLFENTNASFNQFNDEQSTLFDYTVAELQWDKDIRAKIRAAGRPANSYNLIRTILNIIFSIEKDNRKQGKASPRSGGDAELADVVTQTLKYYLYHAGFSKAQKRVFMDKIVARMGVTHIGWRYNGSEDEDGSLFVEACDPREFRWELNYNDPQWMDAGYVLRKYEMSIEEILNTYALRDDELRHEIEKEASVFTAADPQRGKWISRKMKMLFSAVYETVSGQPSSQSNQWKNYMQWWNPYNGKFMILEAHEKRMQRALKVKEPIQGKEERRVIDITTPYTAKHKQLSNREFDGFNFDNEIIQQTMAEYQLQGDVDVDLENKRFVTTTIPSFYIKANEQPYPFDSDYYAYIPEQCYDAHADPIKMQSVIDDIKDPQAEFNKAKSLILELLARYANKGWVMDENAIDGLEEDWTTNRIAPYRRVRSGYIGMIKPEEGQTISAELIKFPTETQQLMKIITNADDEIRGNKSPGVTSGRHFLAKEERQAKSFTGILENRDMAHKAIYVMALNFIQHYVTTQQVIRITKDINPANEEDQQLVINQSTYARGENGQTEEQVVNDITAYKYDIEITEEPYTASALEDRLEKMGWVFEQAKEINPKKADAMLPVLVKALGTPEADEILQIWRQMEQPSQSEQQMQALMQKITKIMAKLGIREKEAEVEGLQLDNIKKTEEIKQLRKQDVFNMLAEVSEKNNGNGKSNGKDVKKVSEAQKN